MHSPHLLPTSARYREIDRLIAYFESRQYESRPDWWSGETSEGRVVPLRERAPCVVYPLPRAAVQQLVRFTIGTGKWPTLNVEDDRVEGDARTDLSQNISRLVDCVGIRPAMRVLMSRALAARTSVAALGWRNGKLRIDLPEARDCIPTFENDDANDAVVALTWVYQYEREVEEDGRLATKKFWFRRDFDTVQVTDFEPVEVHVAEEPAWTVSKETKHGLGFCPVLWMRNMPDAQDGAVDGVSIYEDQLEEFDALNFTLSQRHRGIHYFGTPQPFETGVAADDGPEAEGRRAQPAPGPTGFSGKDAPFGPSMQAARRMAPDYMWSYRNERAAVALMETTGKAFDVASKHVEDVRARILEAIGVVLVNANTLMTGNGAKEMSGRFLQLAYAPMLNHVDELREACWWPHIWSLISMAMRMVAQAKPSEATFSLPKFDEMQAQFSAFVVGSEWVPPTVTPLWGDAFDLTPEEVGSHVKAATDAHTAKLVSHETAARYVASSFGVSDVERELEAIEDETEDAPVVPQVGMAPGAVGEENAAEQADAAEEAEQQQPAELADTKG